MADAGIFGKGCRSVTEIHPKERKKKRIRKGRIHAKHTKRDLTAYGLSYDRSLCSVSDQRSLTHQRLEEKFVVTSHRKDVLYIPHVLVPFSYFGLIDCTILDFLCDHISQTNMIERAHPFLSYLNEM